MSPHTASQKYSFDWRHVSFPASSLSLSPLKGLQPWQFPLNTGSKEEPLLTPLYGELHLHAFPRICWRSSERRKVRVIVDRPRLCRASSVDANVEGLKNSITHQRIVKAIFFSFDAPSQELRSLKTLPFTIFVVRATTWKWLSLDSRRLCGFQSSCHATCKQRRVWAGAGGRQLGRFRRKFFFFGIFGKSYAGGRRETKKIITLALIPKTIGNRKRDCAWGCARGIDTTWENLQIEKHKSGRRSFRSPNWFVLICAFRSADFLRWCLSPERNLTHNLFFYFQ